MEKIKILSQKQNSIVELVKLSNGEEAVIKYYPQHSRAMFIEMNIMTTCVHQNIVNIVDICCSKEDGSMMMVMEKEHHNLVDVLSHPKIMTIDKLVFLLQIAYGIRYLHANNIMHLDLKSENIMVTNGICKIIDFGSSEYIYTESLTTKQLKCTSTHRPPEGFVMDGSIIVIDRAFDIWSFGIIILELYSGTPIYLHKNFPIYQKKQDKSYNYEYDNSVHEFLTSIKFGKFVGDNLPEELHPCLNSNPIFRPNINQIICILTNILNGLVGEDLSFFKFDNSLTLKAVSISKCPNDKTAIKYYQEIYDVLNKKYYNYPKMAAWYTYCLIERLFALGKTDQNYIDQAILMGQYFCDKKYSLLEELVPDIEVNTKKKIIDDIILSTNGILFHFNQYAEEK